MRTLTAEMLDDRLRWPLELTTADITVLSRVFFAAHVRKGMSAADYRRAMWVLDAAEHAPDDNWASLREAALS